MYLGGATMANKSNNSLYPATAMSLRKTTLITGVFLAIARTQVGRYRALKDLEQEHKQLQDLDEAVEHAACCELVERFAVTLDDILAVIQSDRYASRIQVFHFAGHAEADLLVLQNDAGEPLLAGVAGFAAFLATHPRLQLFFVIGWCTKAQIDGLHATGVAVIVAAREEIDDATARDFAVHFHRGLSSGYSIAKSFAAAQGAMQTATYENVCQ